jgi:hypothetical protein
MLAHFGAVRGKNNFKDVSALTVMGRQSPNVRDAERIAAVIIGEPVVTVDTDDSGRACFQKRTGYIRRRDGTLTETIEEYHPVPAVEAVRRSISNAELVQACGRSRAVWRGYGDAPPLVEFVVTSAQTGLVVDEVVSWQELKALTSWIGVLLVAGLWPLGAKRTQMRVKALRDMRARHKWLEPLVGGPSWTDDQWSRWLENQMRDEGVQDLVARIDEAVAVGDASVQLLGADFSLEHMRTVPIRLDGARYGNDTAVRGETVKQLLEAMPAGAEVEWTLDDVVGSGLPSGISMPASFVRMMEEFRLAGQRIAQPLNLHIESIYMHFEGLRPVADPQLAKPQDVQDGLPDDIPASWKLIERETGMGQQEARRLAKRIASGEFAATHDIIEVRALRDGKPYGRVQKRLVRRGLDLPDCWSVCIR